MPNSVPNFSKLNAIFLCALILCAIGCDPTPEQQAEFAQVQGSVWLDGKPVDNARVMFIPICATDDEGYSQSLSYATTNADGNFELLLICADQPGAIVGKHIVLISKNPTGVTDATNDLINLSNTYLRETGKFHNQLAPPTSMQQPRDELIPVIYNRLSMLECSIDCPDQTYRFRFNLTSIDPILEPPSRPLVELEK